MASTELNAYALSDIGLYRTNNEDAYVMLPEKGFFALADGMGGKQGGEVAASTALDLLCREIQHVKTQDPVEVMIELRHLIEKANRLIFDRGQHSEKLLGMGTTLCCIFWIEHAIVYAHVGDSRIYRYRNHQLELLTKDHSLTSEWVSMGHTIRKHPSPYKHIITRALGVAGRANPEIALTSVSPGDLYLLCSDGLSDVLGDEEISSILCSLSSLETSTQKLIETAKIKGSSDNITLLQVQVL